MRADGDGKPITYYKVTLENVMISGVTFNSGDGGTIKEQVHLAYSKIKWEYVKQSVRGGAEGSTLGGWDCAAKLEAPMKRQDQWIDDLAKRNARYPGDFDALIEKYDLLAKNPQTRSQAVIANGECARLPQELTDVGWTGRWHRGPRVLDLDFLLPGTVIGNFKLVDGHWEFPNEHGYHAALFDRFQYGKVLAYGLPCSFTVFDQYNGEHGPKPAGLRPISILPDWYKKQNPRYASPSNRADEFYVVVVP